jgi:hypothetical protein
MRRWNLYLAGYAIVILCRPTVMYANEVATRSIELTLVDDHAIGFATFQSHNQKVIRNRNGIFITYVHKSNGDYTAQQWRLAKSNDRGKSFATIYEATHATSAPAIETDRQGTLYLGHPNFLDGNAYLVRLSNQNDQLSVSTTELKGGSAGKYCLLLDEPRHQLYFFAHNNAFFTIGMDGTVRSKVELLKAGPHAYLQYPHMALDVSGTLFAAWTTSKVDKSNVSIYHDVHAMKSLDGGKNWLTVDGKPIALPAVADDTGPTTLISKPDEFDVHSWLSALMAKDTKLHFVYWAKTIPERQWYVRYDIATGKRDREVQSIFSRPPPQTPNDSGVFVASRKTAGSRLYFVSTVEDRSRLACLASDNNGDTWYEYAISDRKFPARVYSIGAARELTADGAIVGTFTVAEDSAKTYYEDKSGSVYFFRIPPSTQISDGPKRN